MDVRHRDDVARDRVARQVSGWKRAWASVIDMTYCVIVSHDNSAVILKIKLTLRIPM